jgi:hypothetical protein
MRLILIFLVFTTLVHANDSKSNLISYQIITPSDGLASKEDIHTVKDRYEYLWIGTNQDIFIERISVDKSWPLFLGWSPIDRVPWGTLWLLALFVLH